MPHRRVLNVLVFLRNNVRQGVETLEDAREFAGPASGLAEDECLFLGAALSDRHQLESFYRVFVLGLCPGPGRNRRTGPKPSRGVTSAENRSRNPSRGDRPNARYP